MLTELQTDTLQSYIKKAKTNNQKVFSGLKPDKNNSTHFGNMPKMKSSDNSSIKSSNDQSIKPSNNQKIKDTNASPKLTESLGFDPDVLQEEFPTNSMGTSSSTSGTGPIDTFDPILKINGKKYLAKRKTVGHLGSIRSVKTI